MPLFYVDMYENGALKRGSVSAEQKDAALAKLKGMGIDVRKIWAADEDRKPPKNTAVSEPAPSNSAFNKQHVQVIKAFVDDDEEEEAKEGQAGPAGLAEALRSTPDGRAPLAMLQMDDLSRASNVEEATRWLPALTQAPEAERIETLLFGPYKQIANSVNRLLWHKRGRIVHVSPTADMIKGGVLLTVVIEHDAPADDADDQE